MPLPFTDAVLYNFAVTNHGHEYNRELSLVDPLSESGSLGMGLETPTHTKRSPFNIICGGRENITYIWDTEV